MTRPHPSGNRIRERRLALGRKQVDVAAAAGISASYLNLIEHNRRPIGGALLSRLAEALRTNRALLGGDDDEALLEALAAAGAEQGLAGDVVSQASEVARRCPDWAGVVVRQAEHIQGLIRTIDALSDRLTHDPSLAAAMHELLSTVSVVRSTTSILAQTPEIDRNWLGRFHANLDQDSRRLAEGAAAVVALFDGQKSRGDGHLLPSEVVARFLDENGHRFEALESEGAAAIPKLVAGIADPAARAMAEAVLSADAADAERLPRAIVEGARGPDELIEAAGGDLSLVLRRMGVVDPGRGLLVIDASGASLRRKAVAGFALPVLGAGCPLWPVYAALSQPGLALSQTIETPDGAGWRAHAVAAPLAPSRFGARPILRSNMLLTRTDVPAAGAPVGPGCRTCPRVDCAARREPSVVAATP